MSYKFTNSCSLFLMLFKKLLLLLILYSADLAASIPCQSKCDGGGIEIPYPFGIGKDCSLHKYYEIECRKTATSRNSVPFLSSIDKEVVSISLPDQQRSNDFGFGIVRVRYQITSTGCSIDGKDSRSIMNLTSSPFFAHSKNNLVAVGCNSQVSLTKVKPSVVGCELNCDASKESNGDSVPFYGKSRCSSKALLYSPTMVCTENKPEETNCDGNGCCQASIPSDPQQVIGIRIESNDGDSTPRRERCRVAFLTDEAYTLANVTKPEELFAMGYTTVSLGWILQTTNITFLKSLHCKNRKDYGNNSYSVARDIKCVCYESTISEIKYADCECNFGYEGNPYGPKGCVDIDECKRQQYICGRGHKCENIPGYYNCVLDKPKVIMIGVGTGFGVLVVVVGLWWLRKFLIKRRMKKRKEKFFKRNGGLLLQQELNTREGNVEKTRVFTSRELEKATENFSENRVLGHGGQGTVYKGMLVDGRTVAVKKSKVIDEDKLTEFINEVVLLSQINHRHIVKLLGCCLETEVPILVYEFILNGNLFKHIHEESEDYTMVWGMRLRIAVDIAGALSYLHSSANSPIYHRDIKSTNILLDEKYRAKVADFGTSRSITIDQTHWTTVISGTVGYVDPEYYRSSQYTEKSDVYSFGVVLAELITGNKPVITVPNTQNVVSLVEHFRVAMKEKKLIDIIDARIREDCKLEQVMALANLAMKCLSSKGRNRPNMREVFIELERICTSPEDSQVQSWIDEEVEEEEEEDMKITNRNDSWSIGVSAPVVASSSSSSLDVEPLFPRLTW